MFGIRLVFDSSSCATWPLNPTPPADSSGLEIVADTEALQSSFSMTYDLVLSSFSQNWLAVSKRSLSKISHNFLATKSGSCLWTIFPAPFASKGPFTQMRIRKSCKTKIILMPTRVKIQPHHDFWGSKSLLAASISQSQTPKFLKT